MHLRQFEFWFFVAGLLPKPLVYACFMRVMVHATTGEFEKQIVPDLTGMDAIERFDSA